MQLGPSTLLTEVNLAVTKEAGASQPHKPTVVSFHGETEAPEGDITLIPYCQLKCHTTLPSLSVQRTEAKSSPQAAQSHVARKKARKPTVLGWGNRGPGGSRLLKAA